MITAQDKLRNPETNRAYVIAQGLFLYRRRKQKTTGKWYVTPSIYSSVIAAVDRLLTERVVTAQELQHAKEMISEHYTFNGHDVF